MFETSSLCSSCQAIGRLVVAQEIMPTSLPCARIGACIKEMMPDGLE